MNALQIAEAIKPYVLGWFPALTAGYQDTNIDAIPAGVLLQDGTRPLLGNLSVASGVTIDGVDISAIPGYTVGASGLGLSGGGAISTSPTITLASSSNPGVAASILATDATGKLVLSKAILGTTDVMMHASANVILDKVIIGTINWFPSGNYGMYGYGSAGTNASSSIARFDPALYQTAAGGYTATGLEMWSDIRVSAGVVASSSTVRGFYSAMYRQQATLDEGTLGTLSAGDFGYGHYGGTTTKVTSNVYGFRLTNYRQTGTQTAHYFIYLGIVGSNTPTADYSIYSAPASANMYHAGAIAVGTTTFSTYKLSVRSDANAHATSITSYKLVTTNSTVHSRGMYSGASIQISAGVTDSGSLATLYNEALRTGTADAGTLTNLWGNITYAGHTSNVNSSAVTTNVWGQDTVIYHAAGSIGTAYAYRITESGTAPITTFWSIYSTPAAARMYHNGSVSIGSTTQVAAKLNVLSSTEQMRLLYDANNYWSTTISASGVVAFTNVATTGGFTFNRDIRSPDYVSQTTDWRITKNGQGDFRYLYTDELHAKAFITDLEQALAGLQIIAKSVMVLHVPFSVPAPENQAWFIVRDLPSAPGMAGYQDGDTVLFRQFSRASGSLSITNCWGTVDLDTTYVYAYTVTATGGTFTMTVGLNTTAAQPWNVTAGALQTALSGLASVGANNCAVTKTGNAFRIKFVGALLLYPVSLSANSALLTGGSGTLASSGFDTDEKTQRYRFVRSSASNAGAMSDGTVIQPDALVLDFGTAGNGIAEVNAVDGLNGYNAPYYRIANWSTHPSQMTERVRMGKLTGVTSVENEFGLFVGTAYNPAVPYLRLSSNGSEINNVALKMSHSGTTTIRLDPTAPYISVGAPAPVWWIEGGASNGFIVQTDQPSGKTYLRIGETVAWTGSAITSLANGMIWDGGSSKLIVKGDFYIQSGDMVGVMTIGGAGGIYQGSAGSFASPNTGLKLYQTGGNGTLELWSAGALTVSAQPGGIVAAGGAVTIGASGIGITPDTSFVNTRAYRFTGVSNTRLGTYALASGNNSNLNLENIGSGVQNTTINSATNLAPGSGGIATSVLAATNTSSGLGSSVAALAGANGNYVSITPYLSTPVGLFNSSYLGPNTPISVGSAAVNYIPTSADWSAGTFKTNLTLHADTYSSIAFHDSGVRVDAIVVGGGVITMGYNAGWGNARTQFDGEIGDASFSPTLTNSGGTTWANYGSGWRAARVKRVGDLVFLMGLVYRSAGSGTVVMNLGAGYRPPANVMFAQLSNGAVCRVDVYPSGDVTVQGTYSTWLNLDGIVFSIA